MLKKIIVAVAVMALAAPALAGDFCAWVEVSSPENPAAGSNGKPFSARQVLDLEISVLLQGDVGGERLLELRLRETRGRGLDPAVTAEVEEALGRIAARGGR